VLISETLEHWREKEYPLGQGVGESVNQPLSELRDEVRSIETFPVKRPLLPTRDRAHLPFLLPSAFLEASLLGIDICRAVFLTPRPHYYEDETAF